MPRVVSREAAFAAASTCAYTGTAEIHVLPLCDELRPGSGVFIGYQLRSLAVFRKEISRFICCRRAEVNTNDGLTYKAGPSTARQGRDPGVEPGAVRSSGAAGFLAVGGWHYTYRRIKGFTSQHFDGRR